MAPVHALITDALGLSISHKSIFSAIGNEAFLYDGNSRVQLPQRSAQKKVHGFAMSRANASTRLLLLHSETEFSLYKYDANKNEMPFQLQYVGETQDWINAAIFLDKSKSNEFVLHMSHGAILQLQYDVDTKCRILELACCTDYSLLYHTLLHGSQYDELMIISGNGFGEILIWQPRDPVSCVPTKTYPLLWRLKAHNGVVFSIDYHLASGLMVTASDDRSLKFWQFPEEKQHAKEAVRPLFSCFGHTSRVMCAIIIEYGGRIFVISGGEDSYICVWSQAGDMLFKRRQQLGAPIWRLGFDSDSCTVYSTGSTGNLASYNLHNVLMDKQTELTRLMPKISVTEFFKQIKYLDCSSSSIIGLSSKNRLFYTTQSTWTTNSIDVWKLVEIDIPPYKITCLTASDGIAAICGYRRVTLLRYNAETDHFEKLYDNDTILEGLIKSFHFLNQHKYLISDEFGNSRLLSLGTSRNAMQIEGSFRISNGREPWITAALLVASKYLLLSTRNGHVMLYTPQNESESHLYELKDTLKSLHGNMGSNNLKFLNSDGHSAHILSVGHEPIIKVLRICLINSKLSILRRECVPLAWVEASPRLDVLIGFNDNHLVAWSRQNDVLLQLECGGGHRCWDYQLTGNQLNIIYIKQKQVYCHSQPLYNDSPEHLLSSTSQTRWHKRSCNVMALIHPKDDRPLYMLSAGDDNTIKINQFFGDSPMQIAELHTHISSVRHLALYPITEDIDWLIFSVGGRSQLCINRLNLNGPIISELCSHIIRTNTNSVDARLMAIQVLRKTATNGSFSLYLASADGKVRLLRWHLENPSEIHVEHLIDVERCPLQLQLDNANNLLLITTTNGMLYGFDLSLRLKQFQHQLHTAGINSLRAVVDENFVHVLSGGDDENLNYTKINLTDMSTKLIAEFPHLHNAQINALTPLFVCQNELCAYTCSDDKQIFKVNLSTRKCTRIGFTCISDIKGMLLSDNNTNMYIYGSGLHVLSLDKTDC
ncbi:tRNA (34-2'-O)-methyltransferase regulator WDR6 isoform X2 [Drosophila sulfurigaster albostrigata]|uniref:tRNA (34-2'-O)-methyltransferase regulator WDR6 isoform X2 n=1 Tax=Drosophila sulfurigaster albostrigata TaxID=89887 RepID=UPI002D21917B|nr:tRNA (34-2'-O)-methyltransferase regulator WDR6 isoform X2 [Drosophila sulfurigaster albostrigata]